MQLKLDGFEAEKTIPANDSVRLLDEISEALDFRNLFRAYSHIGRKPATNPITLFKILAYGGMDGKHTSRELERVCNRDINYMWLLGDEKAPNHSEIARFRSKRLSECCEDLFYQLVKKLHERGEIRYEHLFVDGTKIEANANKYSFVWKKSTNKYQQRLEQKLEDFLCELQNRYGVFGSAEEIQKALLSKKTVPFVYGRGKRKSQLQRDLEQLSEYISRQQKHEQYQQTFKGRNSFSKTDPDATFMRMKEDHMQGAQLKPGYNVQLAAEGEYITGLDVSSERSDQQTLIPLLDRMDEQFGQVYGDVTADAGYESEENYTYFEKKEQTCYIKPQSYERSKRRKFKSNMHLRENMPYDAGKDEYTCPNGKNFERYTQASEQPNPDLRVKLPITNAKAVRDVHIKRIVPGQRATGKCNFRKSFCVRENSRLKTSPLNRGFFCA